MMTIRACPPVDGGNRRHGSSRSAAGAPSDPGVGSEVITFAVEQVSAPRPTTTGPTGVALDDAMAGLPLPKFVSRDPQNPVEVGIRVPQVREEALPI
jgi:hypothetical protein